MKVRRSIRRAEVYPAPVGKCIRMDLNMNIVLPPPVEDILRGMPAGAVSSYPSQDSEGLRMALAKRFSLGAEQVVTSPGSSQVIDWVFKAFTGPGDRVHTVAPTFSMYDLHASINMVNLVHLPLEREVFHLDWRRFARRRGMHILPSPNNPTGNAFPEERILELASVCERRGDMLVVDEAYAEYAGQDMVSRVDEFTNLVVMRTFSKVYGLPGARIGYAVGSEGAMDVLARVRPPFALSGTDEFIARCMLDRDDYVEQVVSLTRRGRAYLKDALSSLGFTVYPSDANFVLARAPSGVKPPRLVRDLEEKGILIKDLSSTPLLEGCVRITVGPKDINERFIETLTGLLNIRS